MPKIEPAVTQLLYVVPDGTSYVDLAKDLSKVNRRLYRQGMTYSVQSMQIMCVDGMRSSDIYRLGVYTSGNSYMVHNAWKKGYETWRTQQNEYMDGEGSQLKGKWADFKIYLDDSHAGGTTLEPYAGDSAVYVAGEWVYSNFVYDDAGTSRSPSIHLIGTSTEDSAIGLIEAYGEARNFPTGAPSNPAGMATGFYAQFHGVGDIDDELGTDIRDQNDTAPYDADAYQGGETNADAAVPVLFASASAAQFTVTTGGFIAPCGLIKFVAGEQSLSNTTESPTDLGDVAATGVSSPGPLSVYSTGSAPNAFVLLTVSVGPYRGVLASTMGQ